MTPSEIDYEIRKASEYFLSVCESMGVDIRSIEYDAMSGEIDVEYVTESALVGAA